MNDEKPSVRFFVELAASAMNAAVEAIEQRDAAALAAHEQVRKWREDAERLARYLPRHWISCPTRHASQAPCTCGASEALAAHDRLVKEADQ